MKKLSSIVLSVGILALSFTNVAQASSTTYTVEKGDTLYKIATKHKLTVTELKKMNNLMSNAILINQLLVLTPSQSTQEKPIQQNSVPKVKATQKNYTIVKGDTLSKIARVLGVSVTFLKEVNQLKNDNIQIGQILIYTGVQQGSSPQKSAAPIKQMSLADQQIAAQLFKEKAITQAPSKVGQATYDRVIEEAKKLFGTRYLFGGNTKKGIDCSGLIYYAFNKAGYDVPRLDTLGYFKSHSTKVKNPIPGDLIFFKNTYRATISHMGIYLGNNEFIHASTSEGVSIISLDNHYWKERFVSFKRLNVVK